MYTINTKLTNGEHKVFPISFTVNAASPENKPEILLSMADEFGELVTVSASMNAFEIYAVLEIVNALIDGLNESFPVKLSETFNGDDLLPLLTFTNFSNFKMNLKAVECLLKEFGAVIRINLTGKKSEPLQIMTVEAA